MQSAASLRAASVRPIRRQALHISLRHAAHQQAVAQGPSAALPQRVLLRAAPAASRRRAMPRGGSLLVRASWGADVQFSPAKVLERQPAATQLHRLLVDLGAEAAKGYTQPGQFIQVKVGDSKPGFFAIASPPDTNNAGVVELLIKEQPGSTAELLCKAQPGDEVLVSPVMGKGFPVGRVPPATHPTLLLFATGSGVSPVKALLECEEALQAGQRQQVRAYLGARSPAHLAYRERLPEWEAAGVAVLPVYSEDGKGYVQDVFEKENGIEDWSGVAAVLCGQKGMCEAITAYLTSKGVPKEAILLNF